MDNNQQIQTTTQQVAIEMQQMTLLEHILRLEAQVESHSKTRREALEDLRQRWRTEGYDVTAPWRET